MVTVLLTDGEFTGMIRSLREREDVRIIGFCVVKDVAHRMMLDAVYVAPRWDDPAYIPFLLDVIRKEQVDFVFPVVTKSLSLLASAADEIREKTGAVVITSSFPAIEKANHKDELFKTLQADPSTAEYVTKYSVAGTAGKLLEEIYIPCVVKPVIGENKEGFLKAVDDSAWETAFLKGEAGSLTCPSQLKLLGEEACFQEPRLVMPYLPGQEWDADVLVIKGEIVSATIRKNYDMFGGLSSCTETSEDARVLEAVRRIVHVLGLEYLACISFKEDADGRLKVLEINPRAMGSIHVSALGGNNLTTRLLSILLKETGDLSFHLTKQALKTSLYYDILPIPKQGDDT